MIFENNDSGWYRCKTEEPKFKVGEEIEYVLDVKEKRDKSGTYNNISLPKKEMSYNANGSGFKARTKQDWKMDAIFKAMELTVNGYIADKITWEKIGEKSKQVTQMIWDAIDSCYKEE